MQLRLACRPVKGRPSRDDGQIVGKPAGPGFATASNNPMLATQGWLLGISEVRPQPENFRLVYSNDQRHPFGDSDTSDPRAPATMAMITRFPRLRPQRHRPCVRASRLSQMPQRRALSDDTNAEEHSTDQSARLQDSQVPDGKSNRKTLRALQEEHWAEKANKMQAGVEKRILAVLEERGLVKDIAGYVAAPT